MVPTPCTSAKSAHSLRTLKPTRLPANAGMSRHSTTARPSRRLAKTHRLKHLTVGLRAGDHLGTDDDVRRVEEMHAHEVALQVVTQPRAHLGDGEAARDRGDDRAGSARFVHALQERAFHAHLFGDRLEDEVGFRHRALEISFVATGAHALRQHVRPQRFLDLAEALVSLVHGSRQHGHLEAASREESAGSGAHGAVRPEHDDLSNLLHGGVSSAACVPDLGAW